MLRRMNLGQWGVHLASVQLRCDIMALQVAKINARQLLQTFILLPVLGGETTCHGSGSFQRPEFRRCRVRWTILVFHCCFLHPQTETQAVHPLTSPISSLLGQHHLGGGCKSSLKLRNRCYRN